MTMALMNLGVGDGVKTIFPMPNHSAYILAGSDSTLAIYVAGSVKTSGVDYNMTGANAVFTSAPAANALISWTGKTLDRGN